MRRSTGRLRIYKTAGHDRKYAGALRNTCSMQNGAGIFDGRGSCVFSGLQGEGYDGEKVYIFLLFWIREENFVLSQSVSF